MPNEAIIAGVFRLINFLIMILGAGVVFRKYFVPTVSQNMRQKESYLVQLTEQAATLRRAQRITDERIAHDKKYAQVLTKKIEHWFNYIAEQYKQEYQKGESMQAAREQKHDIQKKYIQQQWAFDQALPLALQRAEDQLIQEYLSQEQQEQFINTIIQTMKHRS